MWGLTTCTTISYIFLVIQLYFSNSSSITYPFLYPRDLKNWIFTQLPVTEYLFSFHDEPSLVHSPLWIYLKSVRLIHYWSPDVQLYKVTFMSYVGLNWRWWIAHSLRTEIHLYDQKPCFVDSARKPLSSRKK